MAWTTPMTFSAAAVLTAAQLNTHLRDNLNETCPSTVTTAGDMAYADAANSMGSRLAIGAAGSLLGSSGSAPVWRTPDMDTNFSGGATTNTLTSTAYDDLSGGSNALPAVTATTSTVALVFYGAQYVQNSSAGNTVNITYSVSGASTVAAGDGRATTTESGSASDLHTLSRVYLETGLTAGSNTFQTEAKVSGGTGTIGRPWIVVIPL